MEGVVASILGCPSQMEAAGKGFGAPCQVPFGRCLCETIEAELGKTCSKEQAVQAARIFSLCCILSLCCCDRDHGKSKPEGKGFSSLRACSPSTVKQSRGGTLLTGLLPVACSGSFLYGPGPPARGSHQPQWAASCPPLSVFC